MVNPEDIKICVYAICKNEELFAERWLKSAEEADAIFVNDTGSTDKTIDILKSHPKVTLMEGKVRGDKFRFDKAWNELLEIIPDTFDFCVRLDFDMMFSCGWCERFKKILASIMNSGFYKPATDNIDFCFYEIQFKDGKCDKVDYMWNALAHSYSKDKKYYGAVHEDHAFNNFKHYKSLGIRPHVLSVIHTERKRTKSKPRFYYELGKIRFKECPTYLNYLLYLGQAIDDFFDVLSILDSFLDEMPEETNETLSRLESKLNLPVVERTGRLFIVYLKLLEKFFYEKNMDETKKVLEEIRKLRYNICECSRKVYFNACVILFFNKMTEEGLVPLNVANEYKNNIVNKDKVELYDYILNTFSQKVQ